MPYYLVDFLPKKKHFISSFEPIGKIAEGFHHKSDKSRPIICAVLYIIYRTHYKLVLSLAFSYIQYM